MRIHTSATREQVEAAMRKAKVRATAFSEHGSRSRDRAFEVVLSGASRRRQNGGEREYAATWDQWGVFLASIFEVDPAMKCWAYDGVDAFDHRTNYRFEGAEAPADAHGDHTFRFSGTPYTQSCTKCSAISRWK